MVKYLDEYIDAEEMKAETLISQMDINEDLDVRMQGIFFRNYSDDLICVGNEDNKITLELSRDSIFHLLPEGLFFKEDQLKKTDDKSNFDFNKEQHELKKRKKAVLSFFRPFDTEYFKLTLELEKKLNALAEKGNTVFTEALWDDFEPDTNNEYISKIKPLLPFISQLRGNLPLLADILRNIFLAEKVEWTILRSLYVRCIIHKERLSKEEYQKMDKEIVVFFGFFRQWFLPVEVEYDYRIKDYKQSFILGNTLILDYNTHL